MNKVINSRQAVCGTVWVICLCIIAALWPLRLVTEKVVSGSNRQMSMQSEAITEEYVVEQMFVAQYDHLQSIRIYFLNESAGEEFNFILRDASRNILMQQVISTDDMQEMPGFCSIRVNQETEVGREYYYALQGITSDFYVAYEDTETSGTIYNGTLYYGNVEDTEHNIITEYEYKVPLRKGKTLVCDALLVVFGILVSFITGKYYGKYPDRNGLLTVETVWKRVATPVIIIAALICTVAVWPCKLFSPYAENNLFFIAGILIVAGILLYGVHHERMNKSDDMGLSILRDRWADYLQAAFLAMAIQAGVHYMNGLYEIHHMIAYREMLVYFGLAVIATYKRKELFNWVNFIYLIIAALAGYFYYQKQLVSPEMVMPGTEEGIQVVKLTVWAGIIAGIVILNTIYSIVCAVRRWRTDRGTKERRFSLWYGTVLTVFFVLLLAFRNTRGWPVYLVCAFGLYYVRAAVWEKRDRLLTNICNGILLHFLVMTGYCLLHRPYMFYQYYRYPFIFHTVTISAVYLSLVVCAALVKLLGCYRREQKLSCIWKELTVFGISAVYLLFTLSRTGYLAVAVMALVIIPVICLGMKKKVRSLLTAVAMMFFIVLLCFPAVFTAQRIVPAVAAQPETMEIEELPGEILHGRDLDSNYYMTLRRFIHVFQSKVLGVPDENCINQYKTVKNDSRSDTEYCMMADCFYGDEMLVASADFSGNEISGQEEELSDSEALPEGDGQSEEEQLESDAEAYTNGRLDIFKLYYENLNMEGHDDMYITLPDGNLVVHAHNIYLQAAYDHGVPVGIVFILFGFSTLIQSAVYYRRRKNDRLCSALPLALLILFAIAGLTEWIFHPCNPIAFCLLLMLAPLLSDMGRTAKKEREEMEKKRRPFNVKLFYRRTALIIYDIISVILASYLGILIRYDGRIASIPEHFMQPIERFLPLNILLTLVIFYFFRLYSSLWAFAGETELQNIVVSCVVSTVMNDMGLQFFKTAGQAVPRSYHFLYLCLLVSCIFASRFSYRFFRGLKHKQQNKKNKISVMVVGAGEAANAIIKEIVNSNFSTMVIRCIIDDDKGKWGKYIQGIKVAGGRDKIVECADVYNIDEIIVAMPSTSRAEIKNVLEICKDTNCKLRSLPGMYQLVNGEVSVSKLRDIEVEDLLGREPISVDMDSILGYVQGKTVLVTGGGGSIGSELCRQIAQHKPKQLVILDIYENSVYDVQQELKMKYPELDLVVLIASVRNTNRMNWIFANYRPDIVYHAAAHKHVPLMEDSPTEAIKNNVFGTFKTAQAAAMSGAGRFVMISTDKAVNPTNIMGASKRICEMIIQIFNKHYDTEFVAVRFGNVLGSNGSVIPLFKKQIAEGGPVTVTHPDIIRYFMTIPEAVSLVLQAGAYARGGEIFILDMGEPVKILDLAENLIRLSGYRVGEDIKIEFTGLRPGEKLYEELLMDEEGMKDTANRMIHIGRPIEVDEQEFFVQLKELKDECMIESSDIRPLIQKIVPTYHYGSNGYSE